jgi:hypothetical protein
MSDYASGALNSSFIARCHLGSLIAVLYDVGSTRVSKRVGLSLGCTIPSLPLVFIVEYCEDGLYGEQEEVTQK